DRRTAGDLSLPRLAPARRSGRPRRRHPDAPRPRPPGHGTGPHRRRPPRPQRRPARDRPRLPAVLPPPRRRCRRRPRVRRPGGRLSVSYQASVRPEKIPTPPPATEDVVVDAESIAALRQSRYCQSDAMAGFAATELAALERGPDLARSVAAWVFERLEYRAG